MDARPAVLRQKWQGRYVLAKKCRLERKQGRTPTRIAQTPECGEASKTEWNDWAESSSAELEAPDDQTGEVETHEREP